MFYSNIFLKKMQKITHSFKILWERTFVFMQAVLSLAEMPKVVGVPVWDHSCVLVDAICDSKSIWFLVWIRTHHSGYHPRGEFWLLVPDSWCYGWFHAWSDAHCSVEELLESAYAYLPVVGLPFHPPEPFVHAQRIQRQEAHLLLGLQLAYLRPFQRRFAFQYAGLAPMRADGRFVPDQ